MARQANLLPNKMPTGQTKNFGFTFKISLANHNFLNKKMQINHRSRFVRQLSELLIDWCSNTTLTNQALSCDEIGLNQLREAYTTC